jgi:CheY-like chemotaxis protein
MAFPLVLTEADMPGLDGFALAERIKQDPDLANATIMMLTCTAQRGDAARCREIGVAAYLTKPIGQAERHNAILRVLGANPPTSERLSLVTRHFATERGCGLFSQRTTPSIGRWPSACSKSMAMQLRSLATGAKRSRRLLGERFDLVLMDVQMPEMDGFEATAALREAEKGNGRHLPVIAMTAHAMKGDRERCLAAGMVGYIAKPIRAQELFGEIESLAPAELAGVATESDSRTLVRKERAAHRPRMRHPGLSRSGMVHESIHLRLSLTF